MQIASSTGKTTKVSSFSEWTDDERRGWMLLGEWKEYWMRKRGHFHEFAGLSRDQIREVPQFLKFIEAAKWIHEHGLFVSTRFSGWKQYLAYVCDLCLSRGQRPFPATLMQEYYLGQFNAGSNRSEKAKPSTQNKKLLEIYRKRIHPLLRTSACMQLLGFDLLQ